MTQTLSESIAADVLFRTSFEFAAIGMALVSPNGRFLRVNRSLCEITGYPEVELLRLTFQDITHPEDLDLDLDYCGKLLRGEIETYLMDPNNRTALVEVALFPSQRFARPERRGEASVFHFTNQKHYRSKTNRGAVAQSGGRD